MSRSAILLRPRTGCCTVPCSSGCSQACALGRSVGSWRRTSQPRGTWDGLSASGPMRCGLLKSKAAEREVPLHGILEQLLDTALPTSGRLFPHLTVDKVVKRYAYLRRLTQSCRAPCSTPPASGSSPSVSAQGSLSTSPQPSWGITLHGPPIS